MKIRRQLKCKLYAFLLAYILYSVNGFIGLRKQERQSFVNYQIQHTINGQKIISTYPNRCFLQLWQHVAANSVFEQDRNNVTNDTVRSFLFLLQKAIESEQFAGFTFLGPSKNEFKSIEEGRGHIKTITGRPISLHEKLMVQATFKYHSATDISKNWDPIDCISNIESILVINARNRTQIIPASEWGQPPATCFGLQRGIRSATFQTTNGTEWELKVRNGSNAPKLSHRTLLRNITSSQVQNHDRMKTSLVDLTNPVWRALEVTSSNKGTVKVGMSSKIRQCQKFVEIVDQLVAGFVQNNTSTEKSYISVVDMGCGRGYLTFALHAFLYAQRNSKISSRGIDIRPKLVSEISEIASKAGSTFQNLRFETGTIDSFLAESNMNDKTKDSIEIIIALHACDTATDDALWSGILRGSDIIVVAPCCHRQVRPQLNQHANAKENNLNHPYMDILRHNIYRERIAETVTDSLRALLLEISGYKIQVFEFIGGEHTSKNVMITACKKGLKIKDGFYQDKLKRIQSLAALHGIKHQKLASWIGIPLSGDSHPGKPSTIKHVLASKMPPLS